ncbi:MAG TPA: hypothetical protein VEI97_02715, partial [bacterium]|nr:hypothetical protein [bacterium]
GWQPGGYGLPNTDAFGWGGWSWGCTNTSVETAASGGFAPGYLSHTQDGGASVCSYPEDYGGSANFNIVSPLLQVPTLCGANQVSVTFNYVMYARATATVKIYTSTTNGCSWVAHGSPIIGTGAVQAANNQTITFTGISAGQNLLVRFEFVDTDPVEFNFPASNPFGGIWLDNIRINATSAGTWTPGTPPPPPANYYTDNFEATPTNWSTYGLPQTDAAVAQGGACGFPGPWGGWGVCTATIGQASGNAMTAGGDGGLCNAYSYDMAHTSDFNIVSPAFSLVGVSGTVSIELDEIIGVDQYPWTTTVYMANNPPMGNPTAWGTPVLTYAHTVSESLGTTRLTATVPAALVGQSQVRIRVQVTTPPANPMPDICNGSEGYTVSTSDWIGFDNLRVGAPTCP